MRTSGKKRILPVFVYIFFLPSFKRRFFIVYCVHQRQAYVPAFTVFTERQM